MHSLAIMATPPSPGQIPRKPAITPGLSSDGGSHSGLSRGSPGDARGSSVRPNQRECPSCLAAAPGRAHEEWLAGASHQPCTSGVKVTQLRVNRLKAWLRGSQSFVCRSLEHMGLDEVARTPHGLDDVAEEGVAGGGVDFRGAAASEPISIVFFVFSRLNLHARSQTIAMNWSED